MRMYNFWCSGQLVSLPRIIPERSAAALGKRKKTYKLGDQGNAQRETLEAHQCIPKNLEDRYGIQQTPQGCHFFLVEKQ